MQLVLTEDSFHLGILDVVESGKYLRRLLLSRVKWKRPDSLNKLKEATEFELAAYVEE